MQLAKQVGKRGFRSWYERQLIESHLYLITCFLLAFVVLACIEGISNRDSILRGIVLLLVGAASGVAAVAAFNRYAVVMARAQRLANKATCAKCATYGLLRVTDASRIAHPAYDERGVSKGDDTEAAWLRVQCKRCGHEWII